MKIINNIKTIFQIIGRLLDKYIIVPTTKITVLIRDSIDKDGKVLEKTLSKKNNLLIITLILSIIIFIAVDRRIITMVETSAEVLYNQPVTLKYNEDAYVLDGVVNMVDITLIGRSSDLYLAKQIPNHEVTLDLSGLKPGVHKVQLKHKKALDTVSYKLDPSFVTVTIYPKKSQARIVDVSYLNIDSLDEKLAIDKIEQDKTEVVIKGSEETLKNVSTVKALIDVNNFIDTKVGDMALENIPIVAYDKNGKVIDVEIVPSKINAVVTIVSPQKNVPIKFVPVGSLSFGKAINTIEGSINSVTIYGDNSVLDKVEFIEVPIDVEGLKDNKEYNLNIKKPNGVRYISELTANVKVTVDNEISKDFPDIKVEYENLGANLSVNAKSSADRLITVIVKGVESVVNSVDVNSIRAYVDLNGYATGEHQVEVKIEKTDQRLNYVPQTKKVTLVIANKK